MSAPTPTQIREAFTDYRNAWKDVYDEGEADMRAISPEGPWSAEDRAAREDAGRPCIHLDQINQYINQSIGNVRMNKRAVKVMPKGNGANDKDAGRRSSLIMGIEERSQAQPIYLYTFECMIERSFGFALLRTEYQEGATFDQDIWIKPVQNPGAVLISPYFKQPDASDIPEGFVVDRIPKRQFKDKYRDAKVTDFSGAMLGGDHVSDWITDRTVQIAEYWKIEHDQRTLLLVKMPDGSMETVFEDEFEGKRGKSGKFLKGRDGVTVVREREIQEPRVVQYVTNGIEILDEIPWAGRRIPIISCLGPERWVNQGGEAKRQLLSMVRFARDPQMLYDFLATQECELAGMVPKVAYRGAKGQFESDRETWEEINKVPHAFVEYDIVIDGAAGAALPPPERENFDAPFQEYEVAKDAAGRSIQASMGSSPLPTAAQRRSEKSGLALERIDDLESLGNFLFVDRYENSFLHNMGWQINDLITPVLDTQREVPVSLPDGKRDILHVVGKTSHPIDEQGVYEVRGVDGLKPVPEEHIHTGRGEFDVTISAGPSKQSERESQASFVDQLLENMPNLPPPGAPQAKVLALAIRMRPDLGPIGEQIADVFDPPDPNGLPPAAQAAIAQLQGQLTAAQTELEALHMDRAGRVLEQQTKKEIEAMKAQNSIVLQHLKNLVDLVKAELAAKSRSTDQIAEQDASLLEAQLGFHHDQLDRAHEAAHELAMRESAPVIPPGGAESQPAAQP